MDLNFKTVTNLNFKDALNIENYRNDNQSNSNLANKTQSHDIEACLSDTADILIWNKNCWNLDEDTF